MTRVIANSPKTASGSARSGARDSAGTVASARRRRAPVLLDSPAYLSGMTTTPKPAPPVPGLEPMIDVKTLSAYLGVPVSTIYEWRTNHKAPPGYRFGRHLMFAVGDVKAWVEQQRDAGAGQGVTWNG